MIINRKILALQMLVFVFLLVIIFNLISPDSVIIRSLINSDEPATAVDYNQFISTDKNLEDLSQLVSDLNKMEIKINQYYEFIHKDILVVNDDLQFQVDVHYIDAEIWEMIISANSEIIIYNTNLEFTQLNITNMALIVENRVIGTNSSTIQFSYSSHDLIRNDILRQEDGNMEIWMKMESFNHYPNYELTSSNDFSEYIDLSVSAFRWNLASSIDIDKKSLVGVNSFQVVEGMIIDIMSTVSYFWLNYYNYEISSFYSELIITYNQQSGELDGFASYFIIAFLALEIIILVIMKDHIKTYEKDFVLYHQRGFSMRANKIRLWKHIILYPLFSTFITQLIVLKSRINLPP